MKKIARWNEGIEWIDLANMSMSCLSGISK